MGGYIYNIFAFSQHYFGHSRKPLFAFKVFVVSSFPFAPFYMCRYFTFLCDSKRKL